MALGDNKVNTVFYGEKHCISKLLKLYAHTTKPNKTL